MLVFKAHTEMPNWFHITDDEKKWNFYTFKMPDGKAFSVCWRGVHLILMELAALFESVVALSTSRRDSIAEILLMLKRLA